MCKLIDLMRKKNNWFWANYDAGHDYSESNGEVLSINRWFKCSRCGSIVSRPKHMSQIKPNDTCKVCEKGVMIPWSS